MGSAAAAAEPAEDHCHEEEASAALQVRVGQDRTGSVAKRARLAVRRGGLAPAAAAAATEPPPVREWGDPSARGEDQALLEKEKPGRGSPAGGLTTKVNPISGFCVPTGGHLWD